MQLYKALVKTEIDIYNPKKQAAKNISTLEMVLIRKN